MATQRRVAIRRQETVVDIMISSDIESHYVASDVTMPKTRLFKTVQQLDLCSAQTVRRREIDREPDRQKENPYDGSR